MSWAQGVGRMYLGTLGGQSRVASPVSPPQVVPPPFAEATAPEFFDITFEATGAVQYWEVPAGVTSLYVEAIGAGLPAIFAGSEPYGVGGLAVGNIDVTPGETLEIYVGTTPTDGNPGFPDGGSGQPTADIPGTGGCGASDVRQGGSTVSDRVLVAGGAGGLGSAGVSGHGGDPDGGDAADPYPYGGGGATQSAGGAAADGGATAGSFGQGGDGALYDMGGFTAGGGGGGGGYYGGGGGGTDGLAFPGPGGGGSSWVDPSASGISYTTSSNVSPGYSQGLVFFQWHIP